MSKADEMFEKAEHKKVTETKEFALYVKENLEICFYKKDKVIGINTDSGERIFDNTIYDCTEISFQELKAIYLKCQELGWEE